MKNFIVLFNSGGLYRGNLAYFKDVEDGNGEDFEERKRGEEERRRGERERRMQKTK